MLVFLFECFVVESSARLVVFEAAGGFVEDDAKFLSRERMDCTRLIIWRLSSSPHVVYSDHFGQPFIGGCGDVLIRVVAHGCIVLVLVVGRGVEPQAIDTKA